MAKEPGRRRPGLVVLGVVLGAVLGVVCLLFAAPAYLSSASAQSSGNGAQNTRVTVIELTVDSRDTIPIERLHQVAPRPKYPVLVTEDKVVLHPDADRALVLGKKNPRFYFPDDVKSIKDVKYVLIEHDRFAGQMRRGTIRRVLLSGSLPDFPKTFEPGEVFVGPLADTTALSEILVWPEARWRAEEGASLVIRGDGVRKTLKPGESHTFEQEEIDAPLVFLRLKPSKVGSEDDEPVVEKVDAGSATFQSQVTVTFLGERSLEAPK